jgi:hypothetical protein
MNARSIELSSQARTTSSTACLTEDVKLSASSRMQQTKIVETDLMIILARLPAGSFKMPLK